MLCVVATKATNKAEGGDSSEKSNYFCDELAQEHRAEDPGLSEAKEATEAVPAERVRRMRN